MIFMIYEIDIREAANEIAFMESYNLLAHHPAYNKNGEFPFGMTPTKFKEIIIGYIQNRNRINYSELDILGHFEAKRDIYIKIMLTYKII